MTRVDSGDFEDYTNRFDGIVCSGHGSKTESGGIELKDLKDRLKKTGSTLDVAIALSCHGFDFVTGLDQMKETTMSALVIGYWGYSGSGPVRDYRVGKAIDKWLANPQYTIIPYGRVGQDAVGIFVYDWVIPAGSWYVNQLGNLPPMPAGMPIP